MKNQVFKFYYIDGFSGGGVHIRKVTGERVLSTARKILEIQPEFDAYVFVDLDEGKVAAMQKACAENKKARVILGDANTVLPRDVFPKVEYALFRRALCFLDPYKILLSWDVVLAAAKQETIELFIHFPTQDVNRNALRRDRALVRPDDHRRMTQMWGDESWEAHVFEESPGLFEPVKSKAPVTKLVEEFRHRLKEKAGFLHVSKAVPMYNRSNGIVYHLIFASMNETGLRIANGVFKAASKPPKNV
jgi:three-Cys-motif partner protein